MREASKVFLHKLLSAPGPSGYEGPVRNVWKEEVSNYADEVTTDVHGNAIASLGEKGFPRVMLAGHMDELGFQVIHIDEAGYLFFETIGGFDLGIVPGRKVRVHTKKGPILGVLGKKPIHLMSPNERKKIPEKHDLWIDIGVVDGKEAKEIVSVGDPVTYDTNFEILRNELIVSRATDNKAGAWVVAEAMRRVAGSRKKSKATLYSVATVQEEIGLRGAKTSAYGIDPTIGIAVDVTWATDHPGIDKRKTGECLLGGGPVINRGANINPIVFDRLVSIAKYKKIPFQIMAEPGGTGTDANALQLSREGVAAGLVSIPQRYMHTPVEIISLKDIDHCAQLLAYFVLDLKTNDSFIP